MCKVYTLLASFLASLLTLSTMESRGQTAIPINYGDCAQGTISPAGEIDAYTFLGTLNDRIRIRLATSWNYYPQIELYAPNGTLIRRASGYQGVGIDTLSLPATGTFRILVMDDDGQNTGTYSLCLQCTNSPGQSRLISYGQSFEDTLSSRAQMKTYRFSAIANERARLRMSTNWNYYPQLEIYGPAGNLLQRVAGYQGVGIDTLRLVDSGLYTVLALDDDGQNVGNYGFSLQRTFSAAQARSLVCDALLLDTLRLRSQIKAYSFTSFLNDVVKIQMAARWDYYPQLELYGPTGTLLRRLASYQTVVIDTFRIPISGEYTVFALDDDGQNIGSYSITRICLSTSAENSTVGNVPSTLALFQNYPNPFNPETKIKFQLPVGSDASLKVFDVLGREVKTLVNERLQPGSYETTFDGSGLASGVYLYRLQAGGIVQTKMSLLLR